MVASSVEADLVLPLRHRRALSTADPKKIPAAERSQLSER